MRDFDRLFVGPGLTSFVNHHWLRQRAGRLRVRPIAATALRCAFDRRAPEEFFSADTAMLTRDSYVGLSRCEDVDVLLREGHTIRFGRAELRSRTIAAWCGALGYDLRVAPWLSPLLVDCKSSPLTGVSASIIISGEGAGASWHHDGAVGVLAIQVHGMKTWQFAPMSAAERRTIAAKQRINPTRDTPVVDEPIQQCTLNPGDALFIPPYWWHRANAEHGESIGLSFGIVDPTHQAVATAHHETPAPSADLLEPSFWLWRRTSPSANELAAAETERRRLVRTGYQLADTAQLRLAVDPDTGAPMLSCDMDGEIINAQLAPNLVPFARELVRFGRPPFSGWDLWSCRPSYSPGNVFQLLHRLVIAGVLRAHGPGHGPQVPYLRRNHTAAGTISASTR